MKTAIYVEDGVCQLVLTPETAFEKTALALFDEEKLKAKIFTGSFYDCRGGWVRQSKKYSPLHGVESSEDNSLILRVDTDEITSAIGR